MEPETGHHGQLQLLCGQAQILNLINPIVDESLIGGLHFLSKGFYRGADAFVGRLDRVIFVIIVVNAIIISASADGELNDRTEFTA